MENKLKNLGRLAIVGATLATLSGCAGIRRDCHSCANPDDNPHSLEWNLGVPARPESKNYPTGYSYENEPAYGKFKR